MATITNFSAWLSCIDLSDYNDIWSLYHTVSDLSEYSSFKIDVKEETNGTKYFLKSVECDDTLMLASEAARQTFLSIIEDNYWEGMDIEGYYAYHHAMEKDD